MREALEFIRDGYERGDINHVDYRVGAYMAALDALGDGSSSDEGGEALATARDPQAPATVLPDPLNGSDAGHEASEAPAGPTSDDQCVRKEAGVASGSSEAIAEILRRTFGADDVMANGCAARIVAAVRSAASTVEPSTDKPGPRGWPYSTANARANNIIWRLCQGVAPQAIYDALDADGLMIIEKPAAAPTTSPDPTLTAADLGMTERELHREAAIGAFMYSPEPDAVREKLKDPTFVHLNMLAGGIAKPSWANIQHLYPEEFAALSRPAHGDVKAFQELACEKLQDMRTEWACDFKTPENQGQRGHDRTNALYEAIMLVKGLPIARNQGQGGGPQS